MKRNNKNILLFICTFAYLHICTSISAQQSKIDSLSALLKTDKADTNKLNHFNKLSQEYVKIGSYDSAVHNANSALHLSNYLLKDDTVPIASGTMINITIQKCKALAYRNIGITYEEQGNYPEALKKYFASLKIEVGIGNKKGISASYNNIGNLYGEQGNYPEALKNYFASLKMKIEIGDKKGIAISYGNIGNIYNYQGNYAEALKNYFISLKIKEAIGDKKGIAASYNNIGAVYEHQGNYPEALKNHFAALKIKEATGDKQGIALSYNNIGIVYYSQAEQERNPALRKNKFDQSLKNYLASLEIREAIGDKKGISASYVNIGNVYYAQGNYPEALKNYFASLKMEKAMGDQAGIDASYGNIGIVFVGQKKYKEAEEYLLKAKELAIEIGFKEILKETYSQLAMLDSAKGNFKGAYENHKLYILYRDSIDNEETRKKTIQTQMTYDFEKREAVENAEHKKELENQRILADEKSRKQKIVIGFVICGLLLVVVFAGFVFRSLQITRKQKRIIELQKLFVEEKQKEILDSIYYAKRIQQSLLPTEKYIEKNLKRLQKQN